MNKMLKNTIMASVVILMSHQSMAAFTLNGTRFIYEEGRKNLTFEVTNNAKDTYGGQVWIDNVSQSKDGVYMVPTPPFFKVKPEQKQVLRLMNVNPTLPQDRESLFLLNVQEIPPKPEQADGNVLAIAMNTQVKLIYRPKSTLNGRKDAEENLTVTQENGQTILKNPTSYYFAIVSIKASGKEITLSKSVKDKIAQFAPYSDISLGNVDVKGKLSVGAINDWGGEQWYDIH